MGATVTLSTTTLTQQVSASDTTFKVASTSGLTPGTRMFLDRELVSVTGIPSGSDVPVSRGVDGTASTAHAATSTLTIGRADQFYSTDPMGLPPAEMPVSPYINVPAGRYWVAVGDETGPGVGARFWQQQSTVAGTPGPLGIRTTTTTP